MEKGRMSGSKVLLAAAVLIVAAIPAIAMGQRPMILFIIGARPVRSPARGFPS